MKMSNVNRLGALTDDERAIVGVPGDLVSETRVPARGRSSSVMVSLRIDRVDVDALSNVAEQGGRTFSEVAREALRAYVGRQSAVEAAYPERSSESAGPRRKVSEAGVTWRDDELTAALKQYEAESRQAGMREKAWRSYVDYARRFLAWRTGNYTPRGEAPGDRPVSGASVSTAVLREQAAAYAEQVSRAGREQPTVDTYFRHAMFFIRWLEGDFEPGRRLRGLR